MDLALFDFDGTITDSETMPDFMQFAVRPWRLRIGKAMLLPLILAYKAGWVSGSVIRAVICFCGFRQVPVAELERAGVQFSHEHLPTRLRPEAMARIAWHQARGDTVVVVSGGLDLYLKPWCQQHGLQLLCSSLAQQQGVMRGYYQDQQCVGSEKARRVQQHFLHVGSGRIYGRIYAYGDTKEDVELLALADEAYFRWQLWTR